MILTEDLSPQVCRVTETQPVTCPCIYPSSAWGVECISCSISSANYVPASSPNTIASQREPVFAWVSSILRVLNWPQGPHLAGISPVDCFLCLLWFCDRGTPLFFPQGCLPPFLGQKPRCSWESLLCPWGRGYRRGCCLGAAQDLCPHHLLQMSGFARCSWPALRWFCFFSLPLLWLSLLRLRPLPGPHSTTPKLENSTSALCELKSSVCRAGH